VTGLDLAATLQFSVELPSRIGRVFQIGRPSSMSQTALDARMKAAT